MNVALESMILPQRPGHTQHLLHRVIRILSDPRAQKQSLNVVPAVKIERERNHLLHREPRPPDVARSAVDAIQAIVNAEVGQQDFQQRHTPTVRRVTVANARPRGAAQATSARIALHRAAAGTRRVVFRRIGQDGKLGGEIHVPMNSKPPPAQSENFSERIR